MSVILDTYNSISGPSEGLFKDNGSRFIALAYPVESEDEVKDIVNALKNEYKEPEVGLGSEEEAYNFENPKDVITKEDVVIVTDCKKDDLKLAEMISAFRNSISRDTVVIKYMEGRFLIGEKVAARDLRNCLLESSNCLSGRRRYAARY